MKKILVLLMLAVAVLGCRKDPSAEEVAQGEFMLHAQYGVFAGGKMVMEYDEALHQTAVGNGGLLFRLQDDQQTQFVNMVLESRPQAVGATTTLTTTAQGISGLDSKSFKVTVLKVEGKMWLWDPNTFTGFIVP